MKKRLIIQLIVALLVCLTLGILTACGSGDQENAVIKKGGTVVVTFDAGEGVFTDRSTAAEQLHTRKYRVAPGSKVPAPGYAADSTNKIAGAEYLKHRLVGWYHGEVDEETGEVIYGAEFDEKKDVFYKDETIYAKWERRRVYDIVYVKTDSEGKEVEEVLGTYYADNFQSLAQMNLQTPTVEGKTFLEYVTKEGTAFDMSAAYPEDGTVDVKVYTKFLDGEYVLVRTAEDFISKMIGAVSDNFYFLDDIDCTGMTWSMPTRFSGRIEGNNHKIKNLTYNFKSMVNSTTDIGLFAALGTASRTAVFKDLTFENVTLSIELQYELNTMCKVGFLCGTATNLTLDGVTFTNCAITFVEGSLDKLVRFGIEAPYVFGNAPSEERISMNITGSIAHPDKWDVAE